MAKKFLIHPATFKLDGGAMFGIIPKPLWEKKITPDEFNRIKMSLRVLYIETDNHKILIDTGIGDYHSKKFESQFDIQGAEDPIEGILKAHGIGSDEITDVILTHLHFDHVGGLGCGVSGTDLVFPNATVHSHKKHFEYAKAPTVRDSGSFQSHFFIPILDQYQKMGKLNLIQGDEGVIIKDGNQCVTFKTSFGHTPYMIHPIVDDLIYMADLVPMGHHISIPWVMGYDIEPGTTTIYKEKFYQYIIEKNLTMVFEHDIETWGGKLSVDDKSRYTLSQAFKSNQSSFEAI